MMKRTASNLKRVVALIFAMISIVPLPALGQEGRLKLDAFAHLESKATETVDLNIEGPLLRLISTFIPDVGRGDEKALKELVDGIKGIYIRHYEFDKPGEYSEEDVESVRAQLHSWSRVGGVRNLRQGGMVEAYTLKDADKILALVILAADPEEFTVLNVVGSVDPAKLIEMARRFGGLEIEMEKKSNYSASDCGSAALMCRQAMPLCQRPLLAPLPPRKSGSRRVLDSRHIKAAEPHRVQVSQRGRVVTKKKE
jgi:hypothetical protein